MRLPFLTRSRNESYRIGATDLLITLVTFALVGVVALAGIAAVVLVAVSAPAHLGLMLLALLFVLGAAMVYRGMR